jgi:hypothetical protein
MILLWVKLLRRLVVRERISFFHLSLCSIGLDWAGVEWTGSDWTGLNWTKLTCVDRYNEK